MNRAALKARKARRHRRFGSLGNVSTSVPTGRPLTLMYLGFQHESGGRTYTLYEGGRWKKNKQTFVTDEYITLHYKVLGDGGAFLMGSHVSSGVESFLFIRPIRAGEGELKVRIPLPKLTGFRIAISPKIPANIDASTLSPREREFVARNSLAISRTKPAHTLTSPSLGNLGFVPPELVTGRAKGKTEVVDREYWDGKLSTHSFKRHGYTGETSIFAKGGPTKPVGPQWVGFPTAVHAFRAAYYVAEYYDDNNYGWNAIEKPNYRMGSGIPLAMVGQMIYHDDDSIVGSVAFGKDKKKNKVLQGISDEQLLAYDQAVGDFSNLGFLKKAWKATKKAGSKLKKGAKKAWKSTKKAVDNVIPEVRAPGNPEWHWSKGTVKREKIWFMKQEYTYSFPNQQLKSKEKIRLNAKWPAGTVINAALHPTDQYRFKLPKAIPGLSSSDPEAGKSNESNGNYNNKDIRRLAMKVEWYNPKTGTYTLGRHPPYDPEIKGDGKFVLYFRFPRQLTSKDPDVKHYEGFKLAANSKNRGTAHCYPVKGSKGIVYNIVGRPEVIEDNQRISATATVGEEKLQGVTDYDNVVCCVARSNHNAVHVAATQIFAVTDVEKQAYLTQPNFTNIYWKEGEFSPGCKLIVIGQALTGFQKDSLIGITKKKGTLAYRIRNETRGIKRTNDMGGSKDGDLLKIIDVITTDDLLDDIDLTFGGRAIEANVKNIWKEVFGRDLTSQWFFDVNAGLKDKEGLTIPGLQGSNPKNPLHYNVSFQGQEFSFPYSIAIVEVPSNWVGPVVDFEEIAGEWKPTEKSLKEGVGGEAYVYIVGTNALKYDVEQRINMTGEIKEQLAALAAGSSPAESLLTAGQIPDRMVEVSHQAYYEQHQKPAEAEVKQPKGWGIFDFLRPKPFQTDSRVRAKTLLPVGKKVPLGGLSGMNHTIEDVSNRYAADRVTALGNLNAKPTGERTDIQEMFLINPSEPTQTQLGWVTESQPRPSTVKARPRIPQFGSAYNNSNIAKKRGHIMTEPSFRKGK